MPDTVPGDASTTLVLELGAPTTGVLEGYDADWFAIELTAGVGYYFSISGSGDTPVLDPSLYVLAPDNHGASATASSNNPFIDGYFAKESGTYYVSVLSSHGLPNTIGEYTVVATAMEDTIGAGIGTNGTIAVGETVRSGLDTIGDQDWYRIELVGGQTYEFTIDQARFYGAQLYDPNLVIYDAEGNVYATLDDWTALSTKFFADVHESGTYYVAASLWPGFNTSTGTYALSVELEAAGGEHTQMSLTPGVGQNGSLLWNGDSDWYAVQLDAGVAYEFFFSDQIAGADFSSEHIDFSVHLNLYNSAGVLIAQDQPTTTVSPNNYGELPPILPFTPTADGIYYISVRGVDAQDLGYYQIAYDLIDPSPDTVAANASTTATLAVGGTFNSVLQSRSDHDWVAVQLVAGHSYSLSATGAELGVDVGPYAVIRRADGSLLTRDNNFIADATGTFYIDVTVRPTASNPVVHIAPPGEGGAYTLLLEEDAAFGANTTLSLAVGGSYTSLATPIDYARSDVDWIRINLVAGKTYVVTRESLGYFESGASLSLMDAAGQQVSLQQSGRDFFIFKPTSTGAYFIQTWGANEGYRLDLNQVGAAADIYAAGTNSTGVLTTSGPVTSSINYISDADWFAFNIEEGKYYTLSLTGAGINPLSGGAVTAVRNDTQYVSFTSGEDGTTSFFASFTGTIWARVSADSIFGSPTTIQQLSPDTGGYTLNLTVAAPTTDTLAANETTTGVAVLDTPFQSRIDSLGDKDWVRVSVEAGHTYLFEVEGAWFDGSFGTTPPPYYAATTGDIFLRISGEGYSGGGDYTLTVKEASPVDAVIGTPAQEDGVFHIYFAPEQLGWSQERIDTVLAAWATFADYANISVQVVNDRASADLIYLMSPGSGNDDHMSNMRPNVYRFYDEGDTFGPEDFAGYGGAVPGGMGWVNLLQLIGYQIGLTFASSTVDGSTALLGVTEQNRWGDFWLDQGVYTLMGEYAGWRSGRLLLSDVPDPVVSDTTWATSIALLGLQAGPMALDIAALQAMFGANATTNAGATIFNLSNLTNGQFRAIWDTGGADVLRVAATNTSGAVIDLRAATLEYEWGGGGFVSYIRGVAGGYTIAGGVAIENAIGARGADKLIGNDVANTLSGGDGDDVLVGGGGGDSLLGGAGADTASFETSQAAVTADLATPASNAGDAASDTWSSIENLTGSAFNDTLRGNAAANKIDGGAGIDTLSGGGGDDIYVIDHLNDVVVELGGGGVDTVWSRAQDYVLPDQVENLTLIDPTFAGVVRTGTGNALNNTLIGSSGADLLDGAGGNDTLMGGMGADTYIFDGTDTIVELSVSGGIDIVRSSVSYTLGAYLENLTLTGSAAINGAGNTLNNVLAGNSAANSLNGREGNDTIYGGGNDTLIGGVGNDLYITAGGDTVTETSALGGIDTVQSSVAYTLGANVENLTLTGLGAIAGTGNALANGLTGNSAANVLSGLDGADTLRGGGNDTLIGGLGNDTYLTDGGDTISETSAAGGVDTVQSSITYTLGANLENLTLTGGESINGIGNALANVLKGNAFWNVLEGLGGDDTLWGGSNDTLIGGLGNDTYVTTSENLIIVEEAGGGIDTVQSSAGAILSANIENIILTGAAFAGIGNDLANVITGNAADNGLLGKGGDDTINGGLGADGMEGGLGNDAYFVDNVGDVIIEEAGAGTDLVNSSISFVLGANVEKLVLTGSAAINARGNALNNTLAGNGGVNALNGGAGADKMIGGDGGDKYYVDNVGDVVVENANQGIDTIISSINLTLGANVENVSLGVGANLGANGNALDNKMIGNGGANTMKGFDGADSLNGGAGNDVLYGGNGIDVLAGGAGVDTFVLNAAANANNRDTIVDFNVVDDTIRLDHSVFGAVGPLGALAAAAFQIGPAAVNASVRILYNPADGKVFYDDDGSGAHAAIWIATLSSGLALTNADFLIG